MHLLAPEHAQALTDERTWRDNPFVAREARRDTSRRQPFRSFLWMCGTLLLFGGLGLWGLSALYTARVRIPWFLGGDFGTALGILVCGIHVWFLAGAAQKHALRFFTQEASQNTLSSLLLLPMPPFQLALASVVFPWLAAMRMAVALLPVYVFCVGLDGLSWVDLGMLYLSFALIAVVLPIWNRPALSESISEVTPDTETSGGLFRATLAQRPVTPKKAVPFGAGLSYTCFLLMEASVFTLRGGGGLRTLTHYIPTPVLVLIPSSLLSWPLLMARGLITPFDWFGWAVVPLPFVLILFAASRYASLVRVSEYLSVGSYRDLVQTRTYGPRRRLEAAVRFATNFVCFGYLWQWAVRDGALVNLVSHDSWPPLAAAGLGGQIGFVYLLLLITLVWAMMRAGNLGGWLSGAKPAAEDVAARRMDTPSALRYLAAPFLYGGAFYLLCCALARTAPFPAPVVSLAGRMLAIGLPGVAVWLGSCRTFRALPVVGMILAACALLGPPEAHRYAVFSPILGLVNQGNLGLIGLGGRMPSPALWSQWARCGSLLGGLLLLTSLLVRRRQPAAAPAPQVTQIDPTQAGMEAFADAPAAQQKRRADTPVALRLIVAVQRVWDNAVAIKELRARLRGKLDRSTLALALAGSLSVTLILTFGMPQMAALFGGLRQQVDLMGPIRSPVVAALADTTMCWYLVMALAAVLMGINILPNVFAVEREKSTLDFLLATPMRASAIVLGKAAGLLLSEGLALIAMGLWTLLLSLVLTVLIGRPGPLLMWSAFTLSILSLWAMSGMTAVAVASLFPRLQANGVRAFLRILLFYVFIFLPIVLAGQWQSVQGYLQMSGYALWLFCMIGWSALTVLAALIAMWGVRRMRRGDIAYGKANRGT